MLRISLLGCVQTYVSQLQRKTIVAGIRDFRSNNYCAVVSSIPSHCRSYASIEVSQKSPTTTGSEMIRVRPLQGILDSPFPILDNNGANLTEGSVKSIRNNEKPIAAVLANNEPMVEDTREIGGRSPALNIMDNPSKDQSHFPHGVPMTTRKLEARSRPDVGTDMCGASSVMRRPEDRSEGLAEGTTLTSGGAFITGRHVVMCRSPSSNVQQQTTFTPSKSTGGIVLVSGPPGAHDIKQYFPHPIHRSGDVTRGASLPEASVNVESNRENTECSGVDYSQTNSNVQSADTQSVRGKSACSGAQPPTANRITSDIVSTPRINNTASASNVQTKRITKFQSCGSNESADSHGRGNVDGNQSSATNKHRTNKTGKKKPTKRNPLQQQSSVKARDSAAGPNTPELKRREKQRKTVLPRHLLNRVTDYVGVNKNSLPAMQVASDLLAASGSVRSEETQAASHYPRQQLNLPAASGRNKGLVLCENNVEESSQMMQIDTSMEPPSEKPRKKPKRDRKKAKKRKHTETSGVTENADEETDKQKKYSKQRPNYFIAMQITNPVMLARLSAAQKHVLDQQGALSAALVPVQTAHLTVLVLRLDSQQDIDRAKGALDDLQSHLVEKGVERLQLHFRRLGNFRNNVVFAKVQAGPQLDRLTHITDAVAEVFTTHGLESTDNRGFMPHITIMKLSKAPKLRKQGIKSIDPRLYARFDRQDFGCQTVTDLQLCAMLKPKDETGYYHVSHTVEFAPRGGEDLLDAGSDDELHLSCRSDSPTSRASRAIVRTVVMAALQHLAKERDEKRSGDEEEEADDGLATSATSRRRARKVVKAALSEIAQQEDVSLSEHDTASFKLPDPQQFVVELQREVAWSFEKGNMPNTQTVIQAVEQKVGQSL